MSRITSLLVFFYILVLSLDADEINYQNCVSIQDAIVKETLEIYSTHSDHHEELAQLYVSRGESHLLDAQYEKAIDDFQSASFHLGYCHNVDVSMTVAFRIAFGNVVSYDNLGMPEQTQQALEQLQTIVLHVGCSDCIKHQPCYDRGIASTNGLHFQDLSKMGVNNTNFHEMILFCKSKGDKNGSQQLQGGQDNYNDILGPDQSPSPNWCEEVVTGVGRAMDAIACLASNYAVKVALIGIIEALITRGVKCCQAGGFWKACVAPITRKWKEWKNNKENSLIPNAQNLPLYIN